MNVSVCICMPRADVDAVLGVIEQIHIQRYARPADWDLIQQAAEVAAASNTQMVVVGNGDVLTHYEAAARRAAAPSVRGLMVGRGALVKPWIFAEISSGRTWCPSAAERVAVYFRLSQLMKVRLDACELRWTRPRVTYLWCAAHCQDQALPARWPAERLSTDGPDNINASLSTCCVGGQEYFGDDELGARRMRNFLPWHFDFFSRWRPLASSVFKELSQHTPLLQAGREVDSLLIQTGEQVSRLEQLLRCRHPGAHEAMAEALWQAGCAQTAVTALEALSGQQLTDWNLDLARSPSTDAGRKAAGQGSRQSGGDDEAEGGAYLREAGGSLTSVQPVRKRARGAQQPQKDSKRSLKKKAEQAKLPSDRHGP